MDFSILVMHVCSRKNNWFWNHRLTNFNSRKRTSESTGATRLDVIEHLKGSNLAQCKKTVIGRENLRSRSDMNNGTFNKKQMSLEIALIRHHHWVRISLSGSDLGFCCIAANISFGVAKAWLFGLKLGSALASKSSNLAAEAGAPCKTEKIEGKGRRKWIKKEGKETRITDETSIWFFTRTEVVGELSCAHFSYICISADDMQRLCRWLSQQSARTPDQRTASYEGVTSGERKIGVSPTPCAIYKSWTFAKQHW